MRISQSLFYGDHLRTIGQNRKKSMEKLSSGLAINRAGDDAAGLSISTKLSAQVRGISQARRNIMDAKGLLDVAEMGLQGVNEALHRMRELSVQAASDILSDLDRRVVQLEMDEVKKVISSTIKNTSFNTQMVMGTDKPSYIHTDFRVKEKEIGVIRTSEEYSQIMESVQPWRSHSSSVATKSKEILMQSYKLSPEEISSRIVTEFHPEFDKTYDFTIKAIEEEFLGFSDQGNVILQSTRHQGQKYSVSDDGSLSATFIPVEEITKDDDFEKSWSTTYSAQGKAEVSDDRIFMQVSFGDVYKNFEVKESGGNISNLEFKSMDNSPGFLGNYTVSYEKEQLDEFEKPQIVTIEEVKKFDVQWSMNDAKLDIIGNEVIESDKLEISFSDEAQSAIVTEAVTYSIEEKFNLRVDTDSGNLVIENSDGSLKYLELTDVDVDKQVSFSKDGLKLYYVSKTDGRIQEIDLDYSAHFSLDSTMNFQASLRIQSGEKKQTVTGQEWSYYGPLLPMYRVDSDRPSIELRDSNNEIIKYDSLVGFTRDPYRIQLHGMKLDQDMSMNYVNTEVVDTLGKFDFYRINGKNSIDLTIRNLNSGSDVEKIADEDVYYLTGPDPSEHKTDYVLLEESTSGYKLKLFGKYRLGVYENISYSYINQDANKMMIEPHIDLYKDTNSPNLLGAIQVFFREEEVSFLPNGGEGDGYTYDPISGEIELKGNARLLTGDATKLRIKYYESTDEDVQTSKIPIFQGFDSKVLSEMYELQSSGKASLLVRRNGELIPFDDADGFSYTSDEPYQITLHGKYRPNVRDTIENYDYSVSFVGDMIGTQNQNGRYEIDLTVDSNQYIEYYHDSYDLSHSIQLTKSDTVIDFLGEISGEDDVDDGKNGWYYHKEKKRVVLVGEARPSVSEGVKVEYLVGNTGDDNRTFDYKLNQIPKYYGLEEEEDPNSLRVYITDPITSKKTEVPFSAKNGFSLDQQTNTIRLQGAYKPLGGEDPFIEVFYVKDDFSVKIHEKEEETHEINRVFIGEDYESAVEVSPENYIYENGVVTVVGNARPDVNDVENRKINVYVKHSPPKYVEIDDSSYRYNPYVDQWMSTEEVKADIPKEKIKIKIKNIDVTDEKSGESIQTKPIGAQYFDEEGNLKEEYFYLEDGKIRFSYDLEFTEGNHQITISYEAKQVRSYEDQQFTFQVGAGSRQGLNVKINTMENMLFTTDQLRLDTREYADHTINIVDGLLQKVQSEMGSLGAIQNRLDAASSNLAVLEENTTSAMSRILDVDYAKEMIIQIKSSILEQTVIALQVHELNNSESIISLIS